MLNQVTDGGILGHTELALQPRRQSGYWPMCSGRHSPATAQPAALTHTTADGKLRRTIAAAASTSSTGTPSSTSSSPRLKPIAELASMRVALGTNRAQTSSASLRRLPLKLPDSVLLKSSLSMRTSECIPRSRASSTSASCSTKTRLPQPLRFAGEASYRPM